MEHRNFEACVKNINPLGCELKVDPFLVSTAVLKAAEWECCLSKIQFAFFIQCILRNEKKLTPGSPAVRGLLFLPFKDPRHERVEVRMLCCQKEVVFTRSLSGQIGRQA